MPLERAVALSADLRGLVDCVKIGLSLFVRHGPAAVSPFVEGGTPVFLDLKLHDIPHTVRGAASAAGRLGATYLTVHASGGMEMIRAALEGAAEGARGRGVEPPAILAVTALTSLGPTELEALGVPEPPLALVQRWGRIAIEAGAAGLVCSPNEAALLRSVFGPDVLLCTPGIRLDDDARGDQARAATPAVAREAGVDLAVIGRPIHGAEDPVASARRFRRALSGS